MPIREILDLPTPLPASPSEFQVLIVGANEISCRHLVSFTALHDVLSTTIRELVEVIMGHQGLQGIILEVQPSCTPRPEGPVIFTVAASFPGSHVLFFVQGAGVSPALSKGIMFRAFL